MYKHLYGYSIYYNKYISADKGYSGEYNQIETIYDIVANAILLVDSISTNRELVNVNSRNLRTLGVGHIYMLKQS